MTTPFAPVAPRWRKLLRDLWTEKERMLLMVAAIAVSLVAIGTMLGAFAVLRREMAVNYLGTRPASATLELEGDVDSALVAAVRARPGIAWAEARDVVLARARVGRDWRPLLLFVADDLTSTRINRVTHLSGDWPPPTGTMLIERTAAEVVGAGPGLDLLVSLPAGPPRSVPIRGLVHDPGLAPAWQERTGYGYVTRATLARLGQPPVLHELRVLVRDRPLDAVAIDATAQDLARWLAGTGHAVHEIRVPPPGRHPHQAQMTTMLLLMVAFSGLALVLSAILVSNSLSALLARQLREIGVMKAVGARSAQIAGLYATLVAGLGALAFLLAWPVGLAAAGAFAGATARLLNLTITNASVPAWVGLVQLAAGLVVPLLIAAIPITRTSRTTVRAAIDQYGAAANLSRLARTRLPAPVRDVLRRPARLALTLGLLAAGGAMFMAAIDVMRGWEGLLGRIDATRHYDLEIRLRVPEPVALAGRLGAVPGVRAAEAWGYSPAAFVHAGRVDVARTYPDGGHGSMAVMAPPPGTKLVTFPLRAGRWLAAGDHDAVVLSHVAYTQAGRPPLASRIELSLDGRASAWRLVGVIEEVGSPGRAYVTDAAFAAATETRGRARVIRVTTDAIRPVDREAVLRAVEDRLDALAADVETGMPVSELRTAIGGHIEILIQSLLAMALAMALVGVLGLISSMGTSVLERRREFGVMRAIGATPRRIARRVVLEGLWISLMSGVMATVLSVPLAAGLDLLVGSLGFLAPLPLTVDLSAIAVWGVLLVTGTLAATWAPSLRAARHTVRDALAQL